MIRPTPILTRQEIAAWSVDAPQESRSGKALASRLARHGLNRPGQCAGQNWPVACVSLEITQRCNLDCTLCYLSDLSEAVHDLPLAEIYRRIDSIHDHYGAGTNVQISGGDPTLRDRDELVAIVRRVAEREMVPALFTNGIKASRELLRELAAAGLRDVAFHVDLTQDRSGFDSEAALNDLREAYIERARGLGLRILFNTTVFDGNWQEMEALARFFIQHADTVQLASFQLQADTGRGVLRRRGDGVTQDGMMDILSRAAGSRLDFDLPVLGHPRCNRYTALWVIGGHAVPVFDSPTLFTRLLAAGASARQDWRRRRIIRAIARTALCHPWLAIRTAGYALRRLWHWRSALMQSRGRLSKLSFVIHNFMDAESLERDRCESCIFMAAGRDGPVSMCVYNARRDAELLWPVRTVDGSPWNPLTGDPSTTTEPPELAELPPKRLKGRLRAAWLDQRQRRDRQPTRRRPASR